MATPVRLAAPAEHVAPQAFSPRDVVFEVREGGVTYDGSRAIKGVSLDIYRNQVTAIIGPSGCGKSTFIRCFNRLNDLIFGAGVHGRFFYHGADL